MLLDCNYICGVTYDCDNLFTHLFMNEKGRKTKNNICYQYVNFVSHLRNDLTNKKKKENFLTYQLISKPVSSG